MYDTLLFDLDGTLTESAPGIMRSAKIAVDKLGYTGYDPQVFGRFIGPPLHSSFQEHFGMDDAQAQEAVRLYREYYTVRGLYENAVYTGMPNLLRRLCAGGARLLVATSKPQVFAERILAHFGLLRFFERVVGSSLTDRDAGKEELVRIALPADAGRAAMIGDRCFDIAGGQANGIDTIAVGYGYGSREEFVQAGATHIVDTVAALGDLLAPDTPVPPGFFLTVEGLDGSGKTTQMQALADHLAQNGYEVVRTREPGGTKVAEEIRDVVLSPRNLGMCAVTEALLYAAARAEHVHAVVRPALAAGKVVLCDRFVDSSVVYQGGGRGLGIEQVLTINAPAVGTTLPDATVYLRLDARTALQRRISATAPDRIELEDEKFHQRVFEVYDELAARFPERIHVVDATQPIEAIAEQARAAVDAALARR